MNLNIKKISVFGFAAAALWFGYAAWLAHLNLVTLDVRDADLRDVIRKIERQTWEDIAVQKELAGKITLKVTRAPLDAVLNILAEQASARWLAVYPLYTSKRSLGKIKAVAVSELPAKENGWSAWQTRPFGRGFGMFGAALREDNKLISLQLDRKDVETASLALDRFGKSRIVAEDGTKGLINLTLAQVTMPEAVAAVAKQASRKWTVFYVLQDEDGFDRRNRGTNDLAGTNAPPAWDGGGSSGFARGGPGGFRGGEMTEEQKAAAERQFDAQLATMTPEERAKAAAMRQQMEAIRDLPPEQRREAFDKLRTSPEFQAQQGQRQQQMQNRMLSSLKNTTPDQRVERDQRRLERQKQREQRQANRP